MPGQWKEVVRLRFKGSRFRDHALDLCALSELNQFQRIVAETARALWREGHPERERLPRHFEERTRLCLRQIVEGSAIAPLEVYMDDGRLWEEDPTEINEAIELAHSAFVATEGNGLLPERFPKSLLSDYAKLGQSLAEDEELEFAPPGKDPARVTPKCAEHFTILVEHSHDSTVDLTGAVLEADVRQRRFELWVDDKKKGIPVTFSETQEIQVTTALKEHRAMRIRVKGLADMSPQGDILRIKHIEELKVHPTNEVPFDHSARPIGEILEELAAEIPEAEWDKLPEDLTDNLDHYIYGTPRQ